MILCLANMDWYENTIVLSKIKLLNNKHIIFDLNLSLKMINLLIKKYAHKNYLCLCGTSAHKVYKSKNILNKINTIILNKQESLSLTNKKTIKDALFYLIKKNKNLTIIITNGNKTLNAYNNKIIYSCKPPIVKIKNENGAGDVMSAVFNYFIRFLEFKEALIKSIIAGSLEAAGYKNNKKSYLKKIDQMSKRIQLTKKYI